MTKAKDTVKTGIISAAVGASLGAAAVALSDKKTRTKVAKSASAISKKTKTAAAGVMDKAKKLQRNGKAGKKTAAKKVTAAKKKS